MTLDLARALDLAWGLLIIVFAAALLRHWADQIIAWIRRHIQ